MNKIKSFKGYILSVKYSFFGGKLFRIFNKCGLWLHAVAINLFYGLLESLVIVMDKG